MSWFKRKANKQSIILEQKNENTQIKKMSEQVNLNIQGIQNFYNLTSQKKLLELILDKKASQKLFAQYMNVQEEKIFQSEHQIARINYFAQKYSFQALVQKFPKPKSGTNHLLLKILEKKLQKQVITSHQTRKKIWLLASGAKFNMINNKDLYEGLLNYSDYPTYFQRSIIQDLHRTVNKVTSLSVQDDMVKLKNVLIAFSRRNPYIGYCQGLNFIAFFILTMQFTEQQAFFLLTTILQSIVPMDYYTNMIGVVCDQQVFVNILKVQKPHMVQKFNQVGLDPNVLSIQWFVCLFASSLPFYLVKIVWDRLLVEGTRAFIKAGLIILDYFQDSIMTTTQFHQIIMILQKGTKNLQVPESQFNAEFQRYYINKKGLKIARDLYRQYHIKQKLEQKVIQKRGKNVQVKCNSKWPICTVKLQKLKRQRQQPDVWIYRSQNPPKIIHDYLSNKSNNFQKYLKMTNTFLSSNQKSKKNSKQIMEKINLQASTFNYQQDGRNQNVNQNNHQSPPVFFQIIPNKKQLQLPQPKQNNGSQMTIKMISSIPSPTSPSKKTQSKRSGDLIIGRMQHICHRESPQRQKIKKNRKTDLKFISLIFEDEDKNNKQFDEIKRVQTYKKIKKVSQIVLQSQDQENIKKSPNQGGLNQRQKNSMQNQQRNLLARSRTINFYNQFIEQNKQLSNIISGIETYSPQKLKQQIPIEQQEQQTKEQSQESMKPKSQKQILEINVYNDGHKIDQDNQSNQTSQKFYSLQSRKQLNKNQ